MDKDIQAEAVPCSTCNKLPLYILGSIAFKDNNHTLICLYCNKEVVDNNKDSAILRWNEKERICQTAVTTTPPRE